ncbi:MAG: hypothetical protein K5663_06960 [Clostridiales bacterium]|nr:hypothetical protein [Clostridiales bacterium]
MPKRDHWIWLPASEYPDAQSTVFSALTETAGGNYTVAEFQKRYTFDQPVRRTRLRVSADTAFRLYLNDHVIVTGPPSVGGDFIGNETVREHYFAYETEISPGSDELFFKAEVRMCPVQICEYSKGRGGFMLQAELTFDDGSRADISSDESWLCRRLPAYTAAHTYDGRLAPTALGHAETVDDVWHCETAPIPVRTEREIKPEGCEVSLDPGEKKTVTLAFDMIWAGFVCISARCRGEVRAHVACREIDEEGSAENAVFVSDGRYRGFTLHSAGSLKVMCENRSSAPAALRVTFIETHYPADEPARTTVYNDQIDRVLKTAAHTLMICHQTHHLDSPRHCEPLACTGDYYIESLMTLFSYGDMRLSAFDVIRTAQLLERENGRMFHTAYSLIWILLLRDTYMATGDPDLLKRCEQALKLLLARFLGYVGENGLIETPPDYMFVDWIYIDGFTLHHPPKALGQSCLNMYYYAALTAAAQIYHELGQKTASAECLDRADSLRRAINERLFDREAGAYCEGLNTKTPEGLIGAWMPRNTDKRYIRKHSNILAACFGVCDEETGRRLIGRIMREEIEGDCQPYFQHFLLEAVYRLGLRETYTIEIVKRWIPSVQECPKGLAEGFYRPEPGYHFDHSHAWGGAPLYALPKAIMGVEILSPGMTKIRLNPSSLGLDAAYAELMTPYGPVACDVKKGGPPVVTHPRDVQVIIG